MQESASTASGPTDAVHGDLLLAGLRLRVVAPARRDLAAVSEVLTPACGFDEAAAGQPDWALVVDTAQPDVHEDVFREGRLTLALPYGGRRLAVLGMEGGVLRLAACYRPGAAPVLLEVDTAAGRTRLVVTPGDGVGLRWADWLARVFFASRLLASGWRVLHASAVELDGRALVFLAGRRGGKSTLAHRAARERGALFMADDLVLVGPDGLVVGWPTRVAVPREVLGGPVAVGREESSVVGGVPRQRVLFTPPEHRAALGVAYSAPVPLGAAVLVDGAGRGPVRAVRPSVRRVREALEEAARVPQQVLYVSDALGLMGGPRLAEQAAGAGSVAGLLDGVPVAQLVTPVGELAVAGVWPALEELLPLVGGR
ncbi:hypothetical protein [Kitasatospora sp. NPDC088783]|uniref:hypothetical protein n=1 Tax=Kitasatospora sp. NPDC088783 TaxID=3364077 RepID=UPI003803964A